MRPNAITPTFLAALFIAPVLIIFLALLGLGVYCLMGDQKTAIWICGIAFGASVLLAPIAFWMFGIPYGKLPIGYCQNHFRATQGYAALILVSSCNAFGLSGSNIETTTPQVAWTKTLGPRRCRRSSERSRNSNEEGEA